jgi:hypothetical protein
MTAAALPLSVADVRALQKARAPYGAEFATAKAEAAWMQARGHRLSIVQRLKQYRLLGGRSAVRCGTCSGTGRLSDRCGGRSVCHDCDGVGFLELATDVAADLDDAGSEPHRALARAALPSDDLDHGRHAPGLVAGPDGLFLPAARWVSDRWHIDPQEIAARMDSCGTDAVVASTEAGALTVVPMHCRQALCPVCQRSAATKRVRATEPKLAGLVDCGCTLLHVTLTQQAKSRGLRTDGGVTRDTGETLPAALDRWADSFRAARDGLGAVWRSDVAGYVYGVEWTENRNRWHVHGHVLVVLRPGVDPHQAGRSIVAEWVKTPSGGQMTRDAAAQCFEEVEPSKVREVLKYPFKPAHTSDGGLLEVLAGTKGRRLHAAGGCLHGSSVAARVSKVLSEAGHTLEGSPSLTLGTIPGETASDVLACSRTKDIQPGETPADIIRAWPLALAMLPHLLPYEMETAPPRPLHYRLTLPLSDCMPVRYWDRLTLGGLLDLAATEPDRLLWIAESEDERRASTPREVMTLLRPCLEAAAKSLETDSARRRAAALAPPHEPAS